MNLKIWTFALLLGVSASAHAQQPEAANPANPDGTTKAAEQPEATKTDQQTEEVIRKAQKEAIDLMRMPAAQRNAKIQILQDDLLRNTLNRAGFTDKNLQEAVLDFIFDQNQARLKVREAGSKVFKAVGEKEQAASEVPALLTAYLSTVETAKTQREEATKALDEEIGFTKKPQLMAILTMQGIIGDAVWYTGDVQLLGQMGMAAVVPFLMGEAGGGVKKEETIKAAP